MTTGSAQVVEPANDARLGFTPHRKLTAATGHEMTTMWRPPRHG